MLKIFGTAKLSDCPNRITITVPKYVINIYFLEWTDTIDRRYFSIYRTNIETHIVSNIVSMTFRVNRIYDNVEKCRDIYHILVIFNFSASFPFSNFSPSFCAFPLFVLYTFYSLNCSISHYIFFCPHSFTLFTVSLRVGPFIHSSIHSFIHSFCPFAPALFLIYYFCHHIFKHTKQHSAPVVLPPPPTPQ